MLGKLDEFMRFNETALSLRSQRQTVLASNIANADTPNYKAKDIDFTAALTSAMAGAAQPLKTTAAKHFPVPSKELARCPTARRCNTAASCRARWTATRWTWMWNATSSPTTRCATKRALR